MLWHAEDAKRINIRLEAECPDHPIFIETEKQLSEFFKGERTMFKLDLDVEGTKFQKKVWSELLQIPFGQTQTYAQIARKIGNPAAVRAVGAANGKNPVSVIVPCHRVIGASGKLTGYAGGVEMKSRLLQLESRGSVLTLW